MDRASTFRLAQVLSVHDISKPHERSNGRPCWCYKEAERIIRDMQAAGFKIIDTRKEREGEVQINIQHDSSSRFCPNCGQPVRIGA